MAPAYWVIKVCVIEVCVIGVCVIGLLTVSTIAETGKKALPT
ncbi:hypothetical protein [Dietzia cercidiphylli]|nr:hypothetical protein [Dietzia cercidiphylli]